MVKGLTLLGQCPKFRCTEQGTWILIFPIYNAGTFNPQCLMNLFQLSLQGTVKLQIIFIFRLTKERDQSTIQEYWVGF